jgi:hypothetical protein
MTGPQFSLAIRFLRTTLFLCVLGDFTFMLENSAGSGMDRGWGGTTTAWAIGKG